MCVLSAELCSCHKARLACKIYYLALYINKLNDMMTGIASKIIRGGAGGNREAAIGHIVLGVEVEC